MATQRALLVTKVGAPLELTTGHPVPQPGPDQVQLKVKVAGFNPHDTKAARTGLFINDRLPGLITVCSLDSIIPYIDYTPNFCTLPLVLADTSQRMIS
jgi:hypothetical protein